MNPTITTPLSILTPIPTLTIFTPAPKPIILYKGDGNQTYECIEHTKRVLVCGEKMRVDVGESVVVTKTDATRTDRDNVGFSWAQLITVSVMIALGIRGMAVVVIM